MPTRLVCAFAERQGPVVHIFMEYLPLGSISKYSVPI